MNRLQPSTAGVEKIKVDLLGHRQLIFDEAGLTYTTDELYPVPLPIGPGSVSMSSQTRVLYADICWVGVIRKKQWWALIMAVFGWCLGLFWIWVTLAQQDAGALSFSIGFVVLVGIIPTWLFIRGRPFLVIASERECISFPVRPQAKAGNASSRYSTRAMPE